MREPDIEVELTYLPAEHGGRASPVAAHGYRPQFYYGTQDWDAEHEYPGREQVSPGETVTAQIRFLSPEAHLHTVRPGLPFLIREGHKTVAYGVVKRMLGLEANAARAKATGS